MCTVIQSHVASNQYHPICPPIAKLVYFPCADDMFDPVHALLGSFPFLSAPDKDGTTKLNPCQSQRLHGSFVSQPTTDVLFLQLQPLSGHPVCGVTRNDEAICITPAPPDPLIPSKILMDQLYSEKSSTPNLQHFT